MIHWSLCVGQSTWCFFLLLVRYITFIYFYNGVHLAKKSDQSTCVKCPFLESNFNYFRGVWEMQVVVYLVKLIKYWGSFLLARFLFFTFKPLNQWSWANERLLAHPFCALQSATQPTSCILWCLENLFIFLNKITYHSHT